MKFFDAVGPIAISLLVWSQYFAENERKICHIVPSLWQTTVVGAIDQTAAVMVNGNSKHSRLSQDYFEWSRSRLLRLF